MEMLYRRFGLMIIVSTVVMYGLMFLNTFLFDDVRFSQTRLWMAILMGAIMAIIMIIFMWRMYKNIRLNIAIIAGSAVMFVVALWLVRSQATVDDVSYMQAMIPHHSIAIMTSERAHIKDPRVRKLADGIIEAQVREIKEMNGLVADLKQQPSDTDSSDLPPFTNGRDR